MKLFTDGSAKMDYGGIGVYFEDKNIKNISRSYFGKNVTNQRMELTACIFAIRRASKYISIETDTIDIYSDSIYTINCVEKWAQEWIKNGWKRKVGNKLQDNICNLDLIKKLYFLKKSVPVRFFHVRSHQKKPKMEKSPEYNNWFGNKKADELAGMGMRKAFRIHHQTRHQ